MAQHEERLLLTDPTRADDLPIGTNLSWRLQALIQSGRLAPRTRLPGVREFAAGAGVNVNTARSVYRRLEDRDLAVSQQGLGTFVAPYVAVAPTLEQFAAKVAAEAIEQGIDPRELARALYAGSSPRDPFSERLHWEPGPAPRTAEEERSARTALRGQIAGLEAKLASYVEPSESAATPRTPQHPRVASIDELEAIRDDLVGRLERAQAEARRKADREGAARRWREEALADPSAHRWEYATREDLGERGCGRVAVRPAWGPVGALMDWWRVKMSSGCP
ncbi:MAG: GntR family transcriptional regulator [Solirubrobacterales bacterium]